MALPFAYPFKTRALNASSTTSNQIMTVGVPARGFLIDVIYATTPLQSQGQPGSIDVTINGTTAGGANGWGSMSISSTTGNSATKLATQNPGGTVPFVNYGDVLGVVPSTTVGGTVTWVVREF